SIRERTAISIGLGTTTHCFLSWLMGLHGFIGNIGLPTQWSCHNRDATFLIRRGFLTGEFVLIGNQTRVYRPPRAFAIAERSYAVLTQRRYARDAKPPRRLGHGCAFAAEPQLR